MSNAPPLICIVGQSNTGKTTFLEKLIAEFKRRGYRVGTVKHYHGDFEIDHPGKDSWRFARAGADAVCISAPGKAALIKKIERELSLDEIISLMNDVDIVLAEGYKSADRPRIEVLAPQGETLSGRENLICLVGRPASKPKVPCFDPGDASGVVNLLEKLFLPGLVKSSKRE
ncbi:MAG: molybdopterin-guanine dinucleotide biosynthesis protein B [Bacillota bacterium]